MLGIKRAALHTSSQPAGPGAQPRLADVLKTDSLLQVRPSLLTPNKPAHPRPRLLLGLLLTRLCLGHAAHRPPASPTRLASIVVCLFASPSPSGEIYVEPANAWSITVQGSGSVVFRCNRRIPQHLEPSLRTRDTRSLCSSSSVGVPLRRSHTSLPYQNNCSRGSPPSHPSLIPLALPHTTNTPARRSFHDCSAPSSHFY